MSLVTGSKRGAGQGPLRSLGVAFANDRSERCKNCQPLYGGK